MMKKLLKQKMKKALSLVCTLTMLIGLLGVPVQAAGSHTLTINSETDGHTYQAYQVFAGDYSETGGSTKVLSNITWGSGVDGSALLTAIKTDTTYGSKFSGCNTAAEVAKAIDGITDVDFADAFATIVAKHLTTTHTDSGSVSGSNPYTYTISGLGDGYYFINEKSFTGTVDNAYTKYMLQVLDDVNVTAKTDKPSIALKVLENNDSIYKDKWNDAADYSIGSDIPYRIVSLVPDMTNFSTYNYKITDTISNSSTYNTGSAKVYFVSSVDMYGVEISTTTGAGGTLIDPSKYTLTPTGSGFTVEFNDLKKTEGVSSNGYIVVEYTAKLDSDAAINSTSNKVGNPTEVLLTYSNNPNDASGRGETPKDEVDVYTFELPVSKVDADKKALTGATFAVFASETEAQAAATDPSAANLTKALVFTGSAGAYTLGGSITALVDNASGNYAIKGLDQGTYYLVETAAPTGYNRLLEPVTVTVAPTYNAGERTSAYVDGHVPDVTSDQLTAVKINSADGLQVVNQTGTTLPETGGIGTRIFMAVGLTLMIAAAVLIVIRKKNILAK
jgi:LPXTG-motif cell wall-anchored protein